MAPRAMTGFSWSEFFPLRERLASRDEPTSPKQAWLRRLNHG
jgi:hypothetical protein